MKQLYKPVTFNSVTEEDQEVALLGPFEITDITDPFEGKALPINYLEVTLRVYTNEEGDIMRIGVSDIVGQEEASKK